ncbi:MAG: pilin [Nitrospirae bacterium]|nr:pilin [Nitrospirota bacterium]
MIKGYRAQNGGFSFIELMVVISIITLLSAIAIPLFLGFREKSRVRAYMATAAGAVSEIQSWVVTTKDPVNLSLRDLDTNCDGTIDSNDMTNGDILTAGIAYVYANCRNNGKNEKAPWSDTPLWYATSDKSSLPVGQISLVQESEGIELIALSTGNVILFHGFISYQ